MPVPRERILELWERLKFFLRAAARAAISRRTPRTRTRRWSDSDAVIDPPERHHFPGPRRPRGPGDLKRRVVPRRPFIDAAMMEARAELPPPETGRTAAAAAHAAGRSLQGVSRLPMAGLRGPQLLKRPEGRLPGHNATRLVSAAGRAASASRVITEPRTTSKQRRTRQQREYQSTARRKREAPTPNSDARQLTVAVTGFVYRTQSCVDLLDLGVRDTGRLHGFYRACMAKDLAMERPDGRLITMLSTLYMPNAVSRATGKTIKQTAAMARKHPGFEDFYTRRKILARESNRLDPGVQARLAQLWAAFANCLGLRMTEVTHRAFFRRLKRAIDAAKGVVSDGNALRPDELDADKKNMHEDWRHDSAGNDTMDFKHFSLAVWEAAEIACDTVSAAEVVGLLRKLVRTLTVVEPRHGMRILAFPLRASDAYGTPRYSKRKLRAVANLVTRAKGLARLRPPTPAQPGGLPKLPAPSGPPPLPLKRFAIVRRPRTGSHVRPTTALTAPRAVTAEAGVDFLSRQGVQSLLSRLEDFAPAGTSPQYERMLLAPEHVLHVLQRPSALTVAMATSNIAARDAPAWEARASVSERKGANEAITERDNAAAMPLWGAPPSRELRTPPRRSGLAPDDGPNRRGGTLDWDDGTYCAAAPATQSRSFRSLMLRRPGTAGEVQTRSPGLFPGAASRSRPYTAALEHRSRLQLGRPPRRRAPAPVPSSYAAASGPLARAPHSQLADSGQAVPPRRTGRSRGVDMKSFFPAVVRGRPRQGVA